MSSIATQSPRGKWVSPYRVDDNALIKKCDAKHVFKAKRAVGIDESIYQRVKNRVRVVRFAFDDGRVYEIPAGEFAEKSFLHGDNTIFAVTRFVRLADLRLVRSRREHPRQLALALGA